MKRIAIITDADIFGAQAEVKMEQCRDRQAVRAIVFDDNDYIALLNVSENHYHKLPGGGVEGGESGEAALHREMLEEIGCNVSITGEVGMIEEYRKEHRNLHQASSCYTAKVVGKKGKPKFTDEEIAGGFYPVWVPINKAIELLENDQPNDYVGKFIQRRDLIFIKNASEAIDDSIQLSKSAS